MASPFHRHDCTAQCTEFCTVHDPKMTAHVVASDALEDTMYVEHCNRRRAAKRLLWQGFDEWLWPEWWSKREVDEVLNNVKNYLEGVAA